MRMLFSSLVHPCDKKTKAGCSQICNKVGKSAQCACKEGYKLASDKKFCVKGIIYYVLKINNTFS